MFDLNNRLIHPLTKNLQTAPDTSEGNAVRHEGEQCHGQEKSRPDN
jgi:hypothetical protein